MDQAHLLGGGGGGGGWGGWGGNCFCLAEKVTRQGTHTLIVDTIIIVLCPSEASSEWRPGLACTTYYCTLWSVKFATLCST